MSTINEIHFINISFCLLVIISITLLMKNVLQNTSDVYLVYILLLSSILLVASHNPIIIDFVHYSFMVYIFFVSFFSNNFYLLILNSCILTVIILSRKYYNRCVINKKQTDNGIFKKWNAYINKNGTIEQGNILFGATLLLTILKIYCGSNIT